MSKYYFHSEDGRCFPDEDGTELPDIAAARLQAVRIMAEILREHPEEFWETREWKLIVTDDEDMTLFTLETCATLSSAMSMASPAKR